MSEAIRVVDNYKQQKKDYELHQALTGDLILNEYYGLKFNSRKSADQFLKQCKPEMLETLKELYRERKLI